MDFQETYPGGVALLLVATIASFLLWQRRRRRERDELEVPHVVVPGEAARSYENLVRAKRRIKAPGVADVRPAMSPVPRRDDRDKPKAEITARFQLPRPDEALRELVAKARTATDPMTYFEAAEKLGGTGFLSFCDALVASAPLDITLHYRVGRALEKRGSTPQAIQAFRRVVAFDPSFRDVAGRLKVLEEKAATPMPPVAAPSRD